MILTPGAHTPLTCHGLLDYINGTVVATKQQQKNRMKQKNCLKVNMCLIKINSKRLCIKQLVLWCSHEA